MIIDFFYNCDACSMLIKKSAFERILKAFFFIQSVEDVKTKSTILEPTLIMNTYGLSMKSL